MLGLGNTLKNTAFSQIDDYQHEFLSVLYDGMFKDLIIDKFDTQ